MPARERRLTLSRKNDCCSRLEEEYFCCLGLRGRHNSLSGVDGLLKSRKFAMMFRPGRRPEACRVGRGTEMSDDLKFTVQRPPAYGELTDVLPGLFWVRLPMPTAPNHVNCWLLDNGPGWTLVDCGLNTDDTFEIWDKLWRGLLRSRPLQNLTFTHAHLDHFGLASYLREGNEMHGAPAAGRMAQRLEDVARARGGAGRAVCRLHEAQRRVRR